MNYTAGWWTQGQSPATNSGPVGSGLVWLNNGACNVGPTPVPTATPVATPTGTPVSGPPPAAGFIFSPYKDTGTNMNWNTNVVSTQVTGSLQSLWTVMPAKDSTVTFAFATGNCGSENWAGVSAASFIAANVNAFASAGKYYIISTGGAAGTFSCSSSSAFLAFIHSYYTTHMLGVDFDIEAGQSQATIDQLVQDVKAAEGTYPTMRFSFTLPTLGGNGSPALGSIGVTTMNAIKSAGLTNYTINLMTMDYGAASPYICVDVGGVCDMGASANMAATDLHADFGVPYNQIELTPMIGGNDNQAEVFSLADVATMSAFVKQNGLAGVHFWSFDRDRDCPLGPASSTCNSYGRAGTLGFTNAFISDLGL